MQVDPKHTYVPLRMTDWVVFNTFGEKKKDKRMAIRPLSPHTTHTLWRGDIKRRICPHVRLSRHVVFNGQILGADLSLLGLFGLRWSPVRGTLRPGHWLPVPDAPSVSCAPLGPIFPLAALLVDGQLLEGGVERTVLFQVFRGYICWF